MSETILREVIRNVLEESNLPGGWKPRSRQALKVPFDGSKGKGEGVGRGEERLAVELDGQIMGGNVSYDVVDAEGRKWEVKEPESKSGGGRVRIEQEGIRAVAPVLRKLASVLTKIMLNVPLLIAGPTGSGKGLPLDAKIYTPSGFKLNKDIKIGDVVSTPDGGTANVVGVFPQGQKQI